MMNLTILNGYRQLPQATGLNYSIINDDGPRPNALGWEVHENSNMDGTLRRRRRLPVLSGDFQQFAIVDRIGTTIELMPHIMGANRRPIGPRGSTCTGEPAAACWSPTRSASPTLDYG